LGKAADSEIMRTPLGKVVDSSFAVPDSR
jgi:hypothetical protein